MVPRPRSSRLHPEVTPVQRGTGRRTAADRIGDGGAEVPAGAHDGDARAKECPHQMRSPGQGCRLRRRTVRTVVGPRTAGWRGSTGSVNEDDRKPVAERQLHLQACHGYLACCEYRARRPRWNHLGSSAARPAHPARVPPSHPHREPPTRAAGARQARPGDDRGLRGCRRTTTCRADLAACKRQPGYIRD